MPVRSSLALCNWSRLSSVGGLGCSALWVARIAIDTKNVRLLYHLMDQIDAVLSTVRLIAME